MKSKMIAIAAVASAFAFPFAASAADAVTEVPWDVQVLSQAEGAEALFQQLDANSDGVIDADEAARSPQVANDFSQIDTDNDGRISPEEWRAYFGQENQG